VQLRYREHLTVTAGFAAHDTVYDVLSFARQLYSSDMYVIFAITMFSDVV